MFKYLAVFWTVAVSVTPNPVVYDQRQTGRTNVRIDVKDALLIAVGDVETGGEYDYSYDYADFTIKPPEPVVEMEEPSSTTSPSYSSTTTSKTTLTTFKATSVAALPLTNYSQTIILEPENSSIIFPSHKPENVSEGVIKIPSGQRPDKIPVVVLQEILANHNLKYLPPKTIEKQVTSRQRIKPIIKGQFPGPEMTPVRHCSPGFFLDSNNRCKRIVRPSKERLPFPVGFRLPKKETETKE